MEAIQKADLQPQVSANIDNGVVANKPPNPPIPKIVPASTEKLEGDHLVIKTKDPIKHIEHPNPMKIRATNKLK